MGTHHLSGPLLALLLMSFAPEVFAQYQYELQPQRTDEAYRQWYERYYGSGQRRGFHVVDEAMVGLGAGGAYYGSRGERVGDGAAITAVAKLWLESELRFNQRLFLVPEVGFQLQIYSDSGLGEYLGTFGMAGIHFGWGGDIGDLFVFGRVLLGTQSFDEDAFDDIGGQRALGVGGQLGVGAGFRRGILMIEASYIVLGFPSEGEVSHAICAGLFIDLIQIFFWMAENLG